MQLCEKPSCSTKLPVCPYYINLRRPVNILNFLTMQFPEGEAAYTAQQGALHGAAKEEFSFTGNKARYFEPQKAKPPLQRSASRY